MHISNIPSDTVSILNAYFKHSIRYNQSISQMYDFTAGPGPTSGPVPPDPSPWGPFIKPKHPKYKFCHKIWTSGMRNSIHLVATVWRRFLISQNG